MTIKYVLLTTSFFYLSHSLYAANENNITVRYHEEENQIIAHSRSYDAEYKIDTTYTARKCLTTGEFSYMISTLLGDLDDCILCQPTHYPSVPQEFEDAIEEFEKTLSG